MNSFTRWCYRIGLLCGSVAVLGAAVLVPFELGAQLPAGLRVVGERAFAIFAPPFMFMGMLLLVAAIYWLYKTWPQLSKATKVVSVLGLLTSTFVGAYLFHWLFPGVVKEQARP